MSLECLAKTNQFDVFSLSSLSSTNKNICIMKKKSLTLLLIAMLCSSTLFTSCIGSFGLTNKVLSWNNTIDNKFVNELVFIAFWIVPVYEISALADVLVINSIEFWSGDNPVADIGSTKKVDTKNGIYTVETKADGYHIEKEGETASIDLVFDKKDKSWNVNTGSETTKLMKFKENDEVVMFLPNGKEMNVELSQAGVLAFQQVANDYSYYAAR